jgi:hypothetical protein
MRRRTRTLVTLAAAAVGAGIAVPAFAGMFGRAEPVALADTPGSGQSVIDWNRQLISILGTPNAQPAKELVLRLVAGRCEICGQSESIRVHHIRKLADLDRLGPEKPAWARIMAKRRRKSLVVCETCHDDIHSGQPVAAITE